MNSNLLKAAMAKFGETQSALADAMGMLPSALSNRISGKIDFKRSEIIFIKNRYKLTCEEVDRIFFAELMSEKDTGKESA